MPRLTRGPRTAGSREGIPVDTPPTAKSAVQWLPLNDQLKYAWWASDYQELHCLCGSYRLDRKLGSMHTQLQRRGT